MSTPSTELYTVTYKNFHIGFGGVDFDLPITQATHCVLKQVHGDRLVKANAQTQQEADAQWTQEINQPIYVKSADCLPVLIAAPHTNTALAIHAGWRGVQQRIVTKSVRHLDLQKDSQLRVWIGPHIQKSSFEVGADVAKLIFESHELVIDGSKLKSKNALFKEFCETLPAQDIFLQKAEKFYIDLSALVLWELFILGIKLSQVEISKLDTKTDTRLHSYRRDNMGGRNYSYILIK